VLIPLWTNHSAQLRRLLREHVPSWADFKVSLVAKYLGIWIGPNSAPICWDEALAKYTSRVAAVAAMGLGHRLTGVAYRMLAVSCLGYVMQILPERRDWEELQHPHLRLLFRGPGNWIPMDWLTRPTCHVRLPSTVVNLQFLHSATLTRAAVTSLALATELAARLDELGASDDLPLRHRWNEWLFKGIPHGLRAAARSVAELGLRRGDRGTQSKIYGALLGRAAVRDDAKTWERRLSRWRSLHPTPPFPRQLSANARCVLNAVAGLPASSRWALIRTWLNGWSTLRRHQKRGPCAFCQRAEDSIEHFVGCAVVRDVGASLTGVPRRDGDKLSFLLLDSSAPSGVLLTRMVAYWHALYRTHNRMRHQPAVGEGVRCALRAELRSLLIRHGALQAAFPSALPLV